MTVTAAPQRDEVDRAWGGDLYSEEGPTHIMEGFMMTLAKHIVRSRSLCGGLSY